MENSGKILAAGGGSSGPLSGQDETAEWYVVNHDRWVGPMTIFEVLEKIRVGEITWAHYAWKQGETNWRRLCDIADFQVEAPEQPTQQVQKQIKEATAGTQAPPPPSRKLERSWFLYYSESQFGPFSEEEVLRYLRIGKIHGRVHAWRDGMENWVHLEEIRTFRDAVSASLKARPPAIQKPPAVPPDPARKAPQEQRAMPRRPLVARILLANETAVVVAVCRDVSIGGMQVLTDHVPGRVGARVKMNVSPAGGELGGKIAPFAAEGQIVRILEDGRGFSFRFEKLPENAQRALEAYIAAGD